MPITFDKTVGKSEANYGYINLTTDNGTTHGGEFPPSNTPLLIFTGDRNYKASINTSQNQIWGGLRRWFRDENIYPGDKIRITYDTTIPHIEDRVRIDISIIDRAEVSITPVEAMLTETKDEDD